MTSTTVLLFRTIMIVNKFSSYF